MNEARYHCANRPHSCVLFSQPQRVKMLAQIGAGTKPTLRIGAGTLCRGHHLFTTQQATSVQGSYFGTGRLLRYRASAATTRYDDDASGTVVVVVPAHIPMERPHPLYQAVLAYPGSAPTCTAPSSPATTLRFEFGQRPEPKSGSIGRTTNSPIEFFFVGKREFAAKSESDSGPNTSTFTTCGRSSAG